MVTPVKYDVFRDILIEAGYHKSHPEEFDFIVEGFQHGFPLGYQSTRKVKVTSNNLKFTVGDEIELWNKVMKEVKLKRFAGPFSEIPYEDDFIQSPIGLVPKDNGNDTRLIFHLSHPHDHNSTSVNANTPKELSSSTYLDFSDAIRLVNECIQQANSCFVGKSDAKSAFRNLGISPRFWRYLILKARNPLDKKWYYFVDKCLLFGASISCAHFQRVSDAIAFLVKFKTKKELVNYLDDFLFTAILRHLCDSQINVFLMVCENIGMLVNIEKTFWSDQIMTFLGFLIDSVKRIVAIPTDKIEKAESLIGKLVNKEFKPKSKRKMTILQLEKICGFLNFLGRAVVPGRAFTRRLYDQLVCYSNLKQHHHIKITDEMLLDLKMWLRFLKHPAAFCRSFLDFDSCLEADDIGFYMDASQNFDLGFGGICIGLGSWMQGKWPEEYKIVEPSIQY